MPQPTRLHQLAEDIPEDVGCKPGMGIAESIPMPWCPCSKGMCAHQLGRSLKGPPGWQKQTGKFKISLLSLEQPWTGTKKGELNPSDCTSKLGRVDAGEGASLQVGGPLGAGELRIVDV